MITLLAIAAVIAATFMHFVIVRLTAVWVARYLGLYDRYDTEPFIFLYGGLIIAWPIIIIGIIGCSFADWVVAPLTVRSDRSDEVGHD